MIRISQIKLPPEHTGQDLLQRAGKLLKVSPDQIKELHIIKKSIDARKKPELFFVYTIDVLVEKEEKVLVRCRDKNITTAKKKHYQIPDAPVKVSDRRPVIIGAGPAGLFAAYLLAQCHLCPIVIERGKRVEERTKDVHAFWETGVLNPTSNVQFGEGGAGTFSDGKLNTLVKDPFGRNQYVLDTFVKFGAPEKISYESKPHIGTDVLSDVIANMRNEIIRLGGTFRFETCLTDLKAEGGVLTAVEVNHTEWIETDCCVLALGHSARDTFAWLHELGIPMEPKAFAVGFRVEHPQSVINHTQYGAVYADSLEAAPYKVTANLANGRGVYSFCMCPGGYVVNASSEEAMLAVNGMSYSDRGSSNANSAIIVSVTPEDFDGTDALAGVRFQRELESRAYALGAGRIPQQLFADYCTDSLSTSYGEFSSETRGAHTFANLRGLLPEEMEHSFIEGMHAFARQIPDFDRPDAILSGVESRTSSPVRICRNENFQSEIQGLYPCGEGAGYAGGITSAAMDGLKVAEAILKYYTAFDNR